MLKKINRVLKLVGLNLVRAKRCKAPKSEGQRVAEFLDEFPRGKRPPYTREELESASLKCAANQPGAVPLPDYTGDAEWHDTGKTHFINDSCPGGHRDPLTVAQCAALEQARVERPNSDNKITGPTS